MQVEFRVEVRRCRLNDELEAQAHYRSHRKLGFKQQQHQRKQPHARASEQELAKLQAAIDATVAGNPPQVTIKGHDGQSLSVAFSLDPILRIESLIAAQ